MPPDAPSAGPDDPASAACARPDPQVSAARPWADSLYWALATGIGLALTAAAVYGGARLGTASAPFLGRYRWQVGPASLLAPAVAVVVTAAAVRGVTDRVRWPLLQLGAYLGALAWALSLALVDGTAGLTRGLLNAEEFGADLDAVGDHPIRFLATFTTESVGYSPATRGHPPGAVLLLWSLGRIGLADHLAVGLLVTALGALAVPLVLSAVRDTCGEVAARRYAPILCLAPYAVWTAVSMDAVVTLLGAALIAAGVRASRRQTTGWVAAGWALAAGLLTGTAALFSYAAPWLGLSVACVYFARRRPLNNIATGLGALVPVLAAQVAGFGWVDGLATAHADYSSRVEPYRSALWWSWISVVALLLAAGPALWASARKLRNTPAWPCLVGAASAVLFSVVAGLTRGGVEHAWLPFFPWLTVAAVAPERQGGPPAPLPVVPIVVGAATAVVIEAVLATLW